MGGNMTRKKIPSEMPMINKMPIMRRASMEVWVRVDLIKTLNIQDTKGTKVKNQKFLVSFVDFVPLALFKSFSVASGIVPFVGKIISRFEFITNAPHSQQPRGL